MKRTSAILLVFTAFTLLFAKDKLEWPLKDYKVIEGRSNGWYKNIFFTSGAKLFFYSYEDNQVKQISTFKETPDVMRHFPFKDADAIVTFSAKNKQIESVVFDKDGKQVTRDEFTVPLNVIDMELQFDSRQKPVFIFLSFENDNFMLDIKYEGRVFNILTQTDPIVAFGLNWKMKSAYFIYQSRGVYYWGIWKNGVYEHLELPFELKAGVFVAINNKSFCYLIDSKNDLWLLRDYDGKYGRKKLLTDNGLRFTEKMMLTQIGGKTLLHMSSESSSNVYWVELKSMEAPGKLESFSGPFPMAVHPGYTKSQGHSFILESSLRHLYGIDLQNNHLAINNFSWNVEQGEGYPELVFRWQKQVLTEEYEYRYILDDRKASNPLPDYKTISGEVVRLKTIKEGEYVFHIQARSKSSGQETPVYHIPIVWKKPPMPSIVVVGEKVDRTVSGNPLHIFIKNFGPYEYYLDINNIPIFDPQTPFTSSRGRGSVRHKLKPGKYYIHIRAQNLQTSQYGPTLHYPIYLETLPLEQNVGTKEYKEDQNELEKILRKIEENASNPEEQARWRKKLEQMRSKMKKDIKDSMQEEKKQK